MAAAFLLCLAFKSLAAPPAGYYLVWDDEFNGPTLDTSKWDYWILGQNRDAINTPDAVSLNGSNLVLTTYTTGGVNYSAILATDQTFRSRYGYWEARIKWSNTNGQWSAFWMQSPTVGSIPSDPQTAGSEIDISEHRYVDGDNHNKNIANQTEVNLHLSYGPSGIAFGSGLVGSGLASGFHTYGFQWTPAAYLFSIDGATVYSFGGPYVSHSCDWTVLSSEVDDTSTIWAGTIPAGGYGSLAASQAKLTVDYVRYYAPMTTLFWTGTNSVSLTDSTNWIADKPPISTSDLTFSFLSGNHLSPVVNQDLGVHSMVFLNMRGSAAIGGTNTLTLGAGGIDMVAANQDVTINCPVSIGANQSWAVGPYGPGNSLVDNGRLSGSAALTKASYGTLTLSDAGAYTGPMTVSGGSLIVNGPLGASSVNVTGGTLAGYGVLTGPVTIQAGGTLSPGSSIGTLTISNSLSLTGSTVMEINAAAQTNDVIRGLTRVAYGGTLTVANQAGTPVASDHFKLFDTTNSSGNFTTLDAPSLGPGLDWDFDPGSGVLRVVNTTPPKIASTVSVNELRLSWAADHTGWILQAQTNALDTGISSNWVDVPGSSATNQIQISVNSIHGAVFYRMIYNP